METPPEVNASIRHIEDVRIVLPEDVQANYSLVDTFMMNSTAYYRISSNGNLLHVDVCSIGEDSLDTYVCSTLRMLEFDS